MSSASSLFKISLQSSGAVWKSRWTSWASVPNKPAVSVDVKQHSTTRTSCKAQKLCENRGGRPWLPVRNSPYRGLCGHWTRTKYCCFSSKTIVSLCNSSLPRSRVSGLIASFPPFVCVRERLRLAAHHQVAKDNAENWPFFFPFFFFFFSFFRSPDDSSSH